MGAWWRRKRTPSSEGPVEREAKARTRLASHAWPPALRPALERLREGGHQAWLVGGTVRDVLLDRTPAEPHTFDVATDLAPEHVTSRFARVEPIGLAHGTVLVLEHALRMEVTTMRREGAYADARRPDHVEWTKDPREDLARRDLTVNAIAWDPAAQVLLDPLGGLADLDAGLLRAVGDPAERFHEDALRPLRVARFAALLGMDVEDATRAALGSALDRSRQVAVERVREELMKMMTAETPSVGWELLREAGLLELWLPELARTFAVPQNRFHAYDVWGHSLATADAAPADKPRVRWAALLHDIGKVDTREIRKGDATFYDHQNVGADLADRALARLRFSTADREAIVHLVREHMFDYRSEWSDAAVRRWIRRVGEDAVADLFDLRIADVIGNGLKHGLAGTLERFRERIERVHAEDSALHVRDLAVSGEDAMRVLGIAPGPEVGRVLERLLEEVLDDPARNDRDALLARLEQIRAERVSRASDP